MNARAVNFRTLDLNLLKVFDVVMAERSVTKAAHRLSMTQPAVSNALRRLRDTTHDVLFVPTPGGMQPTPHAETLWPTVRASLERLQTAFEPQAFDPQRDTRTFTLAMADATAALFVPWLVSELQAMQAQVDLRVVALAARDPLALLEQAAADVALGCFPDAAAMLSTEGEGRLVRHLRLYTCHYVGVMRRGHPLARPGALTLDAYCDAQHLRVSFAGRPRGIVDETLAGLGRQRRVPITVHSFVNAGPVILQSDLLTVLPRSFVAATGCADRLACVTLPFDLPPIEVSLLWHPRHEFDAGQCWLRDLLVRAAAHVRHGAPPPACAAPAPPPALAA